MGPDGICKEYYEMKNSAGQEVQQAVCPEPTKEAKVRFLFRGSGRLGGMVCWPGRREFGGKHGFVLYHFGRENAEPLGGDQ